MWKNWPPAESWRNFLRFLEKTLHFPYISIETYTAGLSQGFGGRQAAETSKLFSPISHKSPKLTFYAQISGNRRTAG